MRKKYSFIGAGNMAGALISGLNESVCVYDKNTNQYSKFDGKDYVFAKSIQEAVEFGDYIFLCVKPQNFDEILPEISFCNLDNKLFVSIAAGITISRISKSLGDVPIIRTIPNTPMMIGKGVTGICRNEFVPDKMFSEICRLFSTLGEVVATNEDNINTLTAATSSAPAYVFLFIKSIADSARKLGLDDENVNDYIARMVIGSAELMLSSGKTPDELISMVTSPKGTTFEALKVFEENNFSKIIDDAMIACKNRAIELANS